MTLPTLIVEAGFAGPDTSPYLVLDDPVRGLLDTARLAGDLVYTDITGDVLALSTRRGSTRASGPWLRSEAGTAQLQLGVTDRRYDPTYLDGPYVAAGQSLVRPMRPVRVRATWDGTTYYLYTGYTDRWVTTYEDPQWVEVAVPCTDAFKALLAYDRAASAAIGASDATGARIGRILDSVGWPVGLRNIATGQTTVQATDLSGPALSEMQTVAETELGELHIAADGDVYFRDRHGILLDSRSNTSQGIFGDGPGELPYESAVLECDDQQIYNLARITRVGGTEQTAEDATSRAQYLTRVYPKSGLLMESDTVAENYGAFVVAMSRDAELRFSEIEIDPQTDPDNLWPQVLGRRIGDRITVRRRPPGGGDTIERDVFIRGIEHKHDVRRGTWITTFTLQSATRFAFMVLDDPILGVLDSNSLAY
jgi:hypothetical protein